jgi:phosphoglycolate phosphatase-like HAD superfamily hydrolase
MLANIQAVVFDLDGTLLDRRRSFERFVGDQWERFADVVRTVDREKYVQILVELDRDGYAPRNELFTGLIAQFELPSGLAETLLNDYRARFPSACLLFPDAAQTLFSLRAAGLKLGLITNGSVRMQSRKLECLALTPIFDTILISDEMTIPGWDRTTIVADTYHMDVDHALKLIPEYESGGDLRGRLLMAHSRDNLGTGHPPVLRPDFLQRKSSFA